MDVRSLIKKSGDQRGRNICQPTGFGCELGRQITHAVRQIGDLGGDDEDPWIVECFFVIYQFQF